MKKIKTLLLVIAACFNSANLFSQILLTYQVNAGSCMYSDSSTSAYRVTNTLVLSSPNLGTITIAPASGSFIYCANGIAGQDTVKLYGCLSNNIITFPICDTFYVVFEVHPDTTDNLNCQAYFCNYLDSSNANAFQFIDYSVYNPVSWSWNFGDSSFSTSQNPSHTYSTQGTWSVCLTTTDSNGCTSNFCRQISNMYVQDIQADLYHQSSVTPGFPLEVAISYYNAGTILMSGLVEYRYPLGTTLNATSIAPLSHNVSSRLLIFNYSNLLPGTSGNIQVDLDVSTGLAIGSVADDTLWANPILADLTPGNNISVVQDTVVASWDPNDKAVSPKGLGESGNVPLNTKELSYRIRFQNTGTAPAQKVVVRDLISNNIDLATLTVADASHSHTTEISGNELVVTFANINLPDSGANYEASQGYINIHALLKANLPNVTAIVNTANIYFDFNTPVITNTVTTTLSSTLTNAHEVSNFDFIIFPNPAVNSISLCMDFEIGAAYEILNSVGQVVLKGEIITNNTSINLYDLAAGFYILNIKQNGRSKSLNFSVMK